MTYRHKEAFCLMHYASADGSIQEILWNSRDGVTPFVIHDRSGQVELTHVHWNLDMCVPDHKPAPGDRIFAGITIERAREFRTRFVEKYWDAPMEHQFGTKAQAIERLAQADYNYGGEPGASPVIDVVPEPSQETEHPTYQDDPTPDEPALPLAGELVDQAKEKQAEAIAQAESLAVNGWAPVTGTSEGKGVWMVMEGTMRDWRGLLSTAKKQLSGIIRDQLSRGADMRVGEALEKLDVLLNELPSGEACDVCRGTRVYGFSECGQCKAKEARCSLRK